jgi:hypothetical protein
MIVNKVNETRATTALLVVALPSFLYYRSW